ncbi:MAG: hypothetical protein SFX73_38490 [Kofleriaceae bacterium]|nr:hypothetical protein [Kofleriaceae bacterium]
MLVLVVVLGFVGSARADAEPTIPDASLRAVKERAVRLERTGAPTLEGRLLAFDDATLTLALSATREVVTVQRGTVTRVFVVDPIAPPALTVTTPAPTVVPPVRRVVGVQMSLLGTLAVDADLCRFRAFASTNLLMPVLTASGDSLWFAAALGAGLTLPLGESKRWRVDVFAEVLPFRTTSHYTYLGFGLGGGLHYTSPSGFTFGMTVPVVGFATRLGSSPTGYDSTFTYNDSLGYYYLAGFAGMPLLTMGYRFAM